MKAAYDGAENPWQTVRCIVFDAYGTLISTGNGSLQAAREILTQAGRKDIPAEGFYADWKRCHRQHIRDMREFINEEAVFRQDLKKLYLQYQISGMAEQDIAIMLNTLGKRKAFDDSQKVLEELSGDYFLCIGSTTDTRPLIMDLKRNHLRVHMTFTSELLKLYKPNPAFYQAILEQLKCKPCEVLFAGDSLIDDVEGPKSVGMKTCWVNRKGEKQGKVMPDMEVRNLEEFLIRLKTG